MRDESGAQRRKRMLGAVGKQDSADELRAGVSDVGFSANGFEDSLHRKGFHQTIR